MLTQRGRQLILNVFFTKCVYSSSFLRHPVPNISAAPTSFPPVLIRRSSSSSTQTALANITAQTCHYHQLSLRDAFLHQTYVWFQAFPSLTLTLSFLTHCFLLLITPWSLPLSPKYPIFQHFFMLSFILPFLLLVLLPSIFLSVSTFLCQNWHLASEKYYALVFSALPYVLAILISVKMESSSGRISFLLMIQCLAQYSLAHVPDMPYGIIMCKMTTCCKCPVIKW